MENDLARLIGQEEALSLVEKPEDKQYKPPKSGMELRLKTAEKRGTLLIPQYFEAIDDRAKYS
ncbi:MAG: hypothetical protein ABFS43_17400 [Thermodesulfobacteriota bacterium]